MSPPDHDLLARLIAPAVALARDYAAKRASVAVDQKSPGQFASEADRAIEARLCETLRAELGAAAILGEEGGGGLDADGSGWAIDPIDGTTNFLRGLPIWGISIGYLVRGEPVAGVIALPELDLVLSAVAGEGIRRNGAPFVRVTDHAAVRLVALGENEFEPGPETDCRAQRLRTEGCAVARYNCAAFSLAAAALGWTEGYIERGCCLWDIAAGAILCREAGLRVETQEVAPGRYAIDARVA